MPLSKNKKSPRSGGKKTPFNGAKLMNILLYGGGFLLAVAGQVLVSKGSHALGLILSVSGIIAAGLNYLGLIDFSKFRFRPSLPAATPKRTVVFKKQKGKKGPDLSTKVMIPPFKKIGDISGLGVIRFFLILAAIYLGMRGQTALADMGQMPSVGLKFYFLGVALFLTALWPWKREGLKLLPLNPKVEWTFFGLIMVLAAFLRIYKLDTIPSGIFFDMGFQGLGGLKILHEHWFPWELNITENFPSAPVPIYFGAIWFMFFKNTQFNLNLFYVTFCLASFPLIYWTFKQLAGSRVALLTIYILAVMRWNMNFSRNSFPPSLLPFFMFATLGCLLYGLRTKKRWTFVTAGALFPIGLYAYQTYIMFPVVVVLCGAYECLNDWKNIKAQWKNLAAFSVIAVIVSLPFFWPMIKNHSLGTRAGQLSIFNRCKQQHSLEPLKINVAYTALMYNRRGDPNPRHNLQDHRQLDDVTGFLLFFGAFYALARGWRRKYFYGLVGFLVMALPCLVTIDPAHSSRMHGQTAFVAFLAAAVISSLWARAINLWGQMGEIIFLVLMVLPLGSMARQNFHTYFVEQANNYSSWAEFSIAESTIGRKFAEYGDKYDCYVSPRYFSHYTIDYLDYFFLDKVKRMDLPDSLAALPAPGRGLLYSMEQGRTGVLDTLKSFYPGGEAEILKDPNGNGFLYFYRVPPEVVDKARGLKAEFSDGKEAQVPRFPEGLPPGPYRATFSGQLFLEQSGEYRFNLPQKNMTWTIGKRVVLPGEAIRLEKGFHPMEMRCSVPEGAVALTLSFDGPGGKNIMMGPKNFITIAAVRGLKGEYFNGVEAKGFPFLTQWDPVLNFVNGNDFPVQGGAMAIRWSGTLNVPATGKYRFSTRTSSRSGLKIDRHRVIPEGGSQGEMTLMEGPHAVEVFYSKQNGWGADFTFLWMKPGDMTLEVVPNSVFGEVR